MKTFRGLLFILVLSAGCNKNNNQISNANCKLTRMSWNQQNQVAGTWLYLYDENGRLKQITDETGNYIDKEYEYYTTELVIVYESGYSRQTIYYMNNKDRADSSVTTYRPDAGQYQKKSYYSYDAEGFLISQQDTRYQLYNGSVYRDTVTSSFTISNGNISKISSSYYGGELIFEYSSLPRPANVPFLYGPAGVFTINGNPELLGRQSKNLESGSAFSPNGIMYNYTYTVDANGLITKMVQSKKGTGEFINSAGFQYNCR